MTSPRLGIKTLEFRMGENQLTLTFWYGPTKKRWWTYLSTRLVFPTLSFPSITTLASTRMALIVTGYEKSPGIERNREAGVGGGNLQELSVWWKYKQWICLFWLNRISKIQICKITFVSFIDRLVPFVLTIQYIWTVVWFYILVKSNLK